VIAKNVTRKRRKRRRTTIQHELVIQLQYRYNSKCYLLFTWPRHNFRFYFSQWDYEEFNEGIKYICSKGLSTHLVVKESILQNIII